MRPHLALEAEDFPAKRSNEDVPQEPVLASQRAGELQRCPASLDEAFFRRVHEPPRPLQQKATTSDAWHGSADRVVPSPTPA
jgi:hypothetical protein